MKMNWNYEYAIKCILNWNGLSNKKFLLYVCFEIFMYLNSMDKIIVFASLQWIKSASTLKIRITKNKISKKKIKCQNKLQNINFLYQMFCCNNFTTWQINIKCWNPQNNMMKLKIKKKISNKYTFILP